MIPFRKFIIALLLFGKNVAYIVDKLKSFGYYAADSDIADIFSEIRMILPDKIKAILDSGQMLDLSDEQHKQWITQFGVFEFYHYIATRGEPKIEDPPAYFKWAEDCLWIHSYSDSSSLVNIFLFNEEPLDSISDILTFKYKKKVGVDALTLYRDTFWYTEGMTAKDAIKYCLPLRDSVLVLRNIRSGGQEVEFPVNADEAQDGCDVSVTFHDSSYIKWKIGYKKFEAPTPKDFLDRVKNDAQFKYYEMMNLTQSVEIEEEEGQNDKIGTFDRTLKRRRNVEEARARMAKQWLDIFLHAHKAMPEQDRDKSDEFFDKLGQIEMQFIDEENIVSIDDCKDILEDIKGDLSGTPQSEG